LHAVSLFEKAKDKKLINQLQKVLTLIHCFLILAIMEGYPTFVISILFIGMNTAVIGDVAGHLGCFIYLKDCVNAIAFVALGTSVPSRTSMGVFLGDICQAAFQFLFQNVNEFAWQIAPR